MRGSSGMGVSVGVLVGLVVAGCSTPSTSSESRPAPVAFACQEPSVGPLPVWARAGFSPPDQPVAHLLSVDRHVVAVPFGWPLREKQPPGRANKVLWVADEAGTGPMTIEARRDTDPELVRRELPNGPGPSILDLPHQGCWQLDLSWPGGRDRIYLRYLGPVT